MMAAEQWRSSEGFARERLGKILRVFAFEISLRVDPRNNVILLRLNFRLIVADASLHWKLAVLYTLYRLVGRLPSGRLDGAQDLSLATSFSPTSERDRINRDVALVDRCGSRRPSIRVETN